MGESMRLDGCRDGKSKGSQADPGVVGGIDRVVQLQHPPEFERESLKRPCRCGAGVCRFILTCCEFRPSAAPEGASGRLTAAGVGGWGAKLVQRHLPSHHPLLCLREAARQGPWKQQGLSPWASLALLGGGGGSRRVGRGSSVSGSQLVRAFGARLAMAQSLPSCKSPFVSPESGGAL